MRTLIALIAVGLIVGYLVPKGVQVMASRPPEPQEVAVNTEAGDRAAVENAVGAGLLHEDPTRRALRQAVSDAANRVDASPCDTRQRRRLSDAFDAYQRHMDATADERVETLTLRDGRVIDVTRHFSDPVEDAMRFALTKPCAN
jgi:hypothetical protein